MARKKVNAPNWEVFEFKSGGFAQRQYDQPTARVTKSGISFYSCEGMENGMEIRVLVNGNKFGVVPFKGSEKKLRSNKKGTRFSISSKKLVKELGLLKDEEKSREIPGKREKVADYKDGWLFGV